MDRGVENMHCMRGKNGMSMFACFVERRVGTLVHCSVTPVLDILTVQEGENMLHTMVVKRDHTNVSIVGVNFEI